MKEYKFQMNIIVLLYSRNSKDWNCIRGGYVVKWQAGSPLTYLGSNLSKLAYKQQFAENNDNL